MRAILPEIRDWYQPSIRGHRMAFLTVGLRTCTEGEGEEGRYSFDRKLGLFCLLM